MFKEYFDFATPTNLAEKLFKIEHKIQNSYFVEEIKNKWSKLKDEIKKMSEDEKKQ